MKKFETPVVEVEKFMIMEVITASTECLTEGGDGSCGNETVEDLG